MRKFVVKLRKTLRHTRRRLREVNTLLLSVDKWYVYGKWANTIIDAIRSLAVLLAIGFSTQTIIMQLADSGEVNIFWICIAFGLYLISETVNSAFQIYAAHRSRQFDLHIDTLLELKIVRHLSSMDLGRLVDPKFIQLKDHAEHRGVTAIKQLFEDELNLIRDIAQLVISIVAVLILQPWLLLLLVVTTIPKIIRSARLDTMENELWEKQHLTRRKKDHYLYFLTNVTYLIAGRMLHFTDIIFDFFTNKQKRLKDENCAMSRKRMKNNLYMLIPERIVGAIIVGVLIWQVYSGVLGFMNAFIVFGSVLRFPHALLGITETVVHIRIHASNYKSYHVLMNTKPLINEAGATPFQLNDCPPIDIHSVSFHYPRTNTYAVNNCNLYIPAGQTIAIVGENGSGKTTLVRLLAKVYPVVSGNIMFGTHNIMDVTQRSLLNHLQYMHQKFQAMELTIDYAIAGTHFDQIDKTRLARVNDIINIDSFVQEKPNGYRSQIGEAWEGGVGFSPGQIQRLVIAAFLYRFFDPAVYISIFDEAMSDCDIQTKHRFYHAITQQGPGKTIIAISHDHSYLHLFERVIVMEHGSVVRDITDTNEIMQYQKLAQQQLATNANHQ